MTTMCHTGLPTLPPPPALFAPPIPSDRSSRVQVRHSQLSPIEEAEFRVSACLQRLAVLRRRIELIEGQPLHARHTRHSCQG